jgi:hypothetical protein
MLSEKQLFQSYQKSLMTDTNLVDGRSESDLLNFMVEYASLINFYDKENAINGNWQPFLLKDPVFLSAQIKNFPTQKLRSIYHDIVQRVSEELTDKLTRRARFINQTNLLFEQLTYVFTSIEQWTQYMQQCPTDYLLKDYIFKELKKTYAEYFWAILDWQEFLFVKTSVFKNSVNPVEWSLFANYNQLLWMSAKGKQPFWEVLGFLGNEVFKENLPLGSSDSDQKENLSIITTNQLLEMRLDNMFQQVGEKVFGFLEQITTYASGAYDENYLKAGNYPDTTLLRAFANMMTLYKKQWNGLTQKHLDFYYQDILMQQPQTATADEVFVSINVSESTTDFLLPKGTTFSAGEDANELPISFASGEDVSLNPAQIFKAYTLSASKIPNKKGMCSLNYNVLNAVNKVAKNEQGFIQKQNIFGASNPPDIATTLSTVIASPMFFLGTTEQRNIWITLNFLEQPGLEIFRNANYFLSTQTAWYEVPFTENSAGASDPTSDLQKSCVQVQYEGDEKTVQIHISLGVTDPAIEAFTKNPDGISSEWPLLKIEFTTFQQQDTESKPPHLLIPLMESPPVMESIKITVTVENMKDFALYNDFGALDATKPFQFFGPAAEQGQNFFIGSNEIFSKPFTDFGFTLYWDALPKPNFASYYEEYNKWLKGTYSKTPQCIEDCKSNNVAIRAFKGMANWIKDAVQDIKACFNFGKGEGSDKKKPKSFVFSYKSFTVSFQQLVSGSWNSIICTNKSVPNKPKQYKLYSSGSKKKQISNCKEFDLQPNTTNSESNYDPYLQLTPLTFSEDTTYGFVNMKLASKYGFGAGIYPQVVNSLALYNAAILMYSVKHPKACHPHNAPNSPYIPLATSISGTYTAVNKHSFSSSTQDTYPIQCFYETPFSSYKVYDNTTPFENQSSYFKKGLSIGSPTSTKEPKGLPLFPAFGCSGQLFLELSNPVFPAQLSLYFELNRSFSSIVTNKKKLRYCGLTTNGWKELSVLSDSTQGFTCSGILTLNMPHNLSNTQTVVSGENYWISIGTTDSLGAYPQMTYLNTNGCALQRSSTSYLKSTTIPRILANTITNTALAVPQIESVVQPFPSFAGKPAETQAEMNLRVASRIKTKDRCITHQDYFVQIQQQFPEVYYSKVVYDSKANKEVVYVVKKISSVGDSDAFLPLVSNCQEKQIQAYLSARISSFTTLHVKNFKPQYLQVSSTVVLNTGYSIAHVKQHIIRGLQIFLSPWIDSDQEQIDIENNWSTAQIASYIATFEFVKHVELVSFDRVSDVHGTSKTDGGTVSHMPNLLWIAIQNMNIKQSKHGSGIK